MNVFCICVFRLFFLERYNLYCMVLTVRIVLFNLFCRCGEEMLKGHLHARFILTSSGILAMEASPFARFRFARFRFA